MVLEVVVKVFAERMFVLMMFRTGMQDIYLKKSYRNPQTVRAYELSVSLNNLGGCKGVEINQRL